MRQISLREFRTRGVKAIEAVPHGETILLAGQQGPAYFLVPVEGDIAAEEHDIRIAMARASLREHACRASEYAPITDEEIEQEIAAVRATRQTVQARKSA